MNPNLDTTPGLRLPEPMAPTGQPAPEQLPQWSPEQAVPAAPEQAMGPAIPSFAVPVAQISDQPAPAPVAPAPLAATPAAAADDDLIEKEWVLKAKQIVAATREDPYQQNRQLAAFKADYMQKRYGKIIKLSE